MEKSAEAIVVRKTNGQRAEPVVNTPFRSSDHSEQMLRKRALKLEVADRIRKIKLGAYRVAGTEKLRAEGDGNRRGTEPYARWCGRTAGVTPPPTRF